MPRLRRRVARIHETSPHTRRSANSHIEERFKRSRVSNGSKSLGGMLVKSSKYAHNSARNLTKDIQANSAQEIKRASREIRLELNKVTNFKERRILISQLDKVRRAAQRHDIKMLKEAMTQIGNINKPIWTTLQKLPAAALSAQAMNNATQTAEDIWGKETVNIFEEKAPSVNDSISSTSPKVSNSVDTNGHTSASATVAAINVV